MRLLYLGDTASPHLAAWVRYFEERGHEAHVCHCAVGPPRPVGAGREHRPLRAMSWRVRGTWRLASMEIRRLVRRVAPAVTHSHQILPAGYLVAAARVRPHVATAWGSEVLLAAPRAERKLRRAAAGANLLTADSRHLLRALAGHGADQGRLRWVPWGVSREWSEPAAAMSREDAARRAGLPAARRLVLAPRGLRDVYRPDVTVQALLRVVARDPEAVGVVLHEDGPTPALAALRRTVDGAPGGDRVVFRPRVAYADAAYLFRAADVCLSVPESESAPNTVWEALAVGTPCVVSDLAWRTEAVYREARVEAVPVGDAEATAAAVLSAFETPQEDIRANAALVAGHLDRERTMGRMEAEYERLAREGA